MQSARATWTDERLDDLSARVDRGFEKVDRDIRDLRTEMKSGHDALRAEIQSGDGAIRADLGTRFDNLERTIHRFGGGMILVFVAAVAGRLFA